MSTHDGDEPKDQVPHSISHFPNGMVCVGNAAGQQLGKYQGNDFREALARDGYNADTLPEIWASNGRRIK